MSQDKIDAIKEYLKSALPGTKVEHRNHFDSGDEQFKVHFEKATGLLKVGAEFLMDNSKEVIVSFLEKRNAAKEIKENPDKGIQAKTTGLSRYDRD